MMNSKSSKNNTFKLYSRENSHQKLKQKHLFKGFQHYLMKQKRVKMGN